MFSPRDEYAAFMDRYWSQTACNLYNAFGRVGFVTALALILAGSMVGKHRLIRYILAGDFFGPWAKVSFMTYLIHMFIVDYVMA